MACATRSSNSGGSHGINIGLESGGGVGDRTKWVLSAGERRGAPQRNHYGRLCKVFIEHFPLNSDSRLMSFSLPKSINERLICTEWKAPAEGVFQHRPSFCGEGFSSFTVLSNPSSGVTFFCMVLVF